MIWNNIYFPLTIDKVFCGLSGIGGASPGSSSSSAGNGGGAYS